MNNVKELVEKFKKEICLNCTNPECDRDIVITKCNSDTYAKCVSYIPNNTKAKYNPEKEVILYLRAKRKI